MTIDISTWHDYFGTVAQVSATLAGLLFVGVTISLNHMLQGRGYLYRAWAALLLQFETLLVGLFALIPGQTLQWLGVELIATGAVVLAGILTFGYFFRDDGQSAVLGSTGPRLVRSTLLYIATLLPAFSGALLLLHRSGALLWLVPAEVICLYLSFGNAWVFAVEIPRRQKEAEDRAAGRPADYDPASSRI
jgi:hypothetical protein